MKLEWLRYGLGELKFVRSRKDLRVFLEKAAYLVPRALGALCRNSPVPYSLQIEPTNQCNVNCICCSRRASSRARGYMDFALFRKIMDEASTIGVKMVRLYAQGEPLLHPDIIKMIAYTKRKGLRIHLVTNGTCLDVPRGEAILRSGLDSGDRVIFSVLGFSKEVHEAIMRGVDHHKVMANIHGFVALRKKFGLNGPVIETVFLNMPENLAERRPFLAYWRPVVDHVRSEGAISRQFAEFNSGQKPPLPVRKRTCAYLWDRLLVFWNGDATICIADLDGTHRLGNLQQQSIREIWSCDNLMAIRQMHRERRFQELPLCSNCDW